MRMPDRPSARKYSLSNSNPFSECVLTVIACVNGKGVPSINTAGEPFKFLISAVAIFFAPQFIFQKHYFSGERPSDLIEGVRVCLYAHAVIQRLK